MLFNSWQYIILLLISLATYWSISNLSARRWILIIASAFFYCSWSAPFFLLFLAVTAVNWWAALLYERHNRQSYINLAIILSLGILFLFKYTDFVIGNINSLTSLLGSNQQLPLLRWELPLGISFYVFQIVAYTIDVNRRTVKAEKSYWNVTLFVLYFPHLIAGPICRSTQLLPQLKVRQYFKIETFIDGLFILLGGFVLKSCFADGIAPYVNLIFSNYVTYSGQDLFWGMVGFGIQIFCDFWGYSLMAVGSAKLFGYTVPYNFNLPYFAPNIQMFWKQWHITLSSWLRDYLYIPLGGSRGSNLKTYRNLFLTMLLGGIWHGANWTFVVWGSIHGVALSIHRFISERNLFSRFTNHFAFKACGWLATMLVVYISWIFFRAENISVAFGYIQRMVIFDSSWLLSKVDHSFFELLLLFLPTHLLVHHFSFRQSITKQRTFVFAASFVFLAILSIIYYVDGQDFIYFQF